jgi:Protein of unknown function (DUF2911)
MTSRNLVQVITFYARLILDHLGALLCRENMRADAGSAPGSIEALIRSSERRTSMQRGAVLLMAIMLIFGDILSSQMSKDKSQRPSPPAQAQCKLSDGKTITVDYSSPRTKGRQIFGGLVPYGEVWRTGANEATTFVTTANLKAGNVNIPAGNYTIFTVPNQDSWKLIINKKTGEWGIPYKYESDELGRVDMKVSQTSAPVEDFTIAFDQKGSSCDMSISWDRTKATTDFSEVK